MVNGEDPLDFLSRVDKVAEKLAMIGDGKSEEEVKNHIVLNFSGRLAFYKKSITSRLGIPRCDIDEIIHGAYTDDKVENVVTEGYGLAGVGEPARSVRRRCSAGRRRWRRWIGWRGCKGWGECWRLGGRWG